MSFWKTQSILPVKWYQYFYAIAPWGDTTKDITKDNFDGTDIISITVKDNLILFKFFAFRYQTTVSPRKQCLQPLFLQVLRGPNLSIYWMQMQLAREFWGSRNNYIKICTSNKEVSLWSVGFNGRSKSKCQSWTTSVQWLWCKCSGGLLGSAWEEHAITPVLSTWIRFC